MTPSDRNRILSETWLDEVEYHATLPSTNDRAMELAKSPQTKLPLLVIADQQTAGRGRGGNQWWTGEGSLAFSVLLDSTLADKNWNTTPLVGLAAGLAIVDTVRLLIGEREIGLHWPNDVFVSDRKLAGILVEVLPNRKIVVGIGLNVNNSLDAAPRELQTVATTLYDLTRIPHDRISLLISLLNHLGRYLKVVQNSPAELAAAADAVCLQKNQLLHLKWGKPVYSGICRGIDSTGAILLETPEGVRPFSSGILLKLKDA